MAMIVTNDVALSSVVALSNATRDAAQATQRISTTLRINNAKDDSAGLMLANRLKAQISSHVKAIDNINSAISMVQSADKGLSSIASTLTSMRDLALSSSTGTTSAATRTSNQTLLQSYLTDINSVVSASTHNGISLLDGSTPSLKIQTGVDNADTSLVKLFSAGTSVLGKGDTIALSSQGASAPVALSSGDLLINGVTVGGSLTTDDNYSYALKSGSAIAKAAAINRVSATTNVEAKVGTTQVAGASMSATGATSGTITINGVGIAVSLNAGDTLDTNRAAVITAINLNAGQTGVSASDGGDSSRGITLTAADGRNITLSSTVASARTGLAADDTYSGGYTLRSLGNSGITLASQIGKTISNAGVVAGTYSANTAQVTSTARSGSMSAPTTLSSGDLTINGYTIGAGFDSDDTSTVATTTSSSKASSAISIAAAINRQSANTGVTATANTNALIGSSFSAGDVDSIYLNGTTIGVSFTSSTSLDAIVTALQPYAGQTGVVVANNGSGLTMTAVDGRNISIGISNGGVAVSGSAIGLGGIGLSGAKANADDSMTYISTVKLSSSAAFTLAAGTNGATNMQTLGFRAGIYGGSAEDTKIAALNISTQTGGSNALTVIDKAIEMVSSYQALAGAQNNVLDYRKTLNTDQSTIRSTAYGNIMNADLAAEAANLASAEIRKNAAAAMIAQANLMSKQVVSYLLKPYTG
jgi:flagellin